MVGNTGHKPRPNTTPPVQTVIIDLAVEGMQRIYDRKRTVMYEKPDYGQFSHGYFMRNVLLAHLRDRKSALTYPLHYASFLDWRTITSVPRFFTIKDRPSYNSYYLEEYRKTTEPGFIRET
uniref:Uncharacterized protein n=1 Tax=Romanomermis culicivorax TaxID=13658 RepID=A0A915L662_ROMCU